MQSSSVTVKRVFSLVNSGFIYQQGLLIQNYNIWRSFSNVKNLANSYEYNSFQHSITWLVNEYSVIEGVLCSL